MVKKFTAEDFNEANLKHDGVVLVDFYANWCGPCKMLAPVLEELSEERNDVIVAKVNIDENASVATDFKINGIPVMYVFKNGEVQGRLLGWHSKEQLNNALDGYIYGV
jgi:thioredoxin 1